MPDLVRDDVERGEVARSLEAAGKLVEEGGVDVDRIVVRAVERAHRSLTHAAGGLRAAGIGHHSCRNIALSALSEDFRPGLLGRAEAAGEEIAHVRVERRAAAARSAGRRAAGQQPASSASELGQRAIAHEQDEHSDDAEAAHDQRQQASEHVPSATAESEAPAAARAVFEMGTGVLAAEPNHSRLLLSRPNARATA